MEDEHPLELLELLPAGELLLAALELLLAGAIGRPRRKMRYIDRLRIERTSPGGCSSGAV